MSGPRAGTCAEPGPGDAHCTEHPGHRYSCYDAGADVSWNDGQWDQFDLPAHQCDECARDENHTVEASGQPEADR